MVKISFIIFFFIGLVATLGAQRLNQANPITFSGVVIDAKQDQVLPDVSCRDGNGRVTFSDEEGRFHLTARRGDTVYFTSVGFKPCQVIVPDTLRQEEYMVGVFMNPDTLQLSEALIIGRFVSRNRDYLRRARSNMSNILQQAYTPVPEMDAQMNQQMMIEEYARSVEMRGHVDVRAGVGTQSLDALRLMRLRKKLRDEKQELNEEEVDLLKKLYNLEKKENVDN